MSTATWWTIALFPAGWLVGGILGTILPSPYILPLSILSGVALSLVWYWKTKTGDTP